MNRYATQPEPNAVRFERDLPGPIERVWAYLVEPEKRALWFAGGALDLRAGGGGELVFNNACLDDQVPEKYAEQAGEIRGAVRVVAAEPPRLLAFEWPAYDDHWSEVRFELEERGDRVRLVLTESRLERPEWRAGNAGGWHAHLDVLEALLAGQEPPRFWAVLETVRAEYEAQLAPAQEV